MPTDIPIFPTGYRSYVPHGGAGSPVPDARRLNLPDPSREYVAWSNGYVSPEIPQALPNTVDDVTRDQGGRVYDAMLTDPIVSGSVTTLKLAILSGGINFVSTLPIKAGQEPTPDEKIAQDMVDFCWRVVDRAQGFNESLLQLLDATTAGCKLAEKVYDVAESGEDKGKLVLKALKVKPREAWQFVVDEALNVLGIMARRPDGFRVILPRDKFVVHSWMPKDSDPRGTSLLRAAYGAWNMKVQAWPQYYQYLQKFASGSVFGTTAPGEQSRQPVDENGDVILGEAMVSPEEYMASQLANLANGSTFVGPPGSTVSIVYPTTNGEAFLKAFELVNQELIHGILLQTRATREAQFGSRADSEQGQDILGLLVSYGREALGCTLRDDLFRHLVSLNFGEEIAQRFTPYVEFGDTEQHDKGAMWTAAAGLGFTIGESQIQELDAMLGLPVRDVEADRKAAEEALLKQQEMMGGDDAETEDDPTPEEE